MDIDPLPSADPLSTILSVIICTIDSFGASQIIALIFALMALLLSGFMSGSEIAFFSIEESQLEELEDNPKGQRIIHILEKPEKLLATILIANNLVNVTIVVLTNFALGPVFSGMSAVRGC